LYAHSKITNVEEQSENSPYRYNRLRFVEFLELIGRVADFAFTGSELQNIGLTQKIQFVLNEVFKVAGVRGGEGRKQEDEAGRGPVHSAHAGSSSGSDDSEEDGGEGQDGE